MENAEQGRWILIPRILSSRREKSHFIAGTSWHRFGHRLRQALTASAARRPSGTTARAGIHTHVRVAINLFMKFLDENFWLQF